MRSRVTLCLVLALAIATLVTGCTRDPNIRKVNFLQKGEQYFAEGKYKEAGIEFQNAIKLDDNYAAAHYDLGKTYKKFQKWPNAYQEFTRTLELQPENFDARVDLANLLIETGDLQQANQQSKILLQQRPNDARTHFIAGSLLAAQNRFPAAIAEMQKAISLNPNDGNFYMNLALMQVKNQQSDEAEANFKKAVTLNPNDLNASLMMGTYYQSRGHYSEAESEYRRAIQVAPKSVDARAAFARLLLAENRKGEAEAFLKQVKQDFPDDSTGYRMLGDYYFSNGELDKARAEYASLYSQHSSDLEVKRNYVQLLIMAKQFDEATRIVDEILKSSPGDVGALTYSGQLQLINGNPNAAVTTLQAAVKNDPSQAGAHYQLGLAYQAQGDLHSAEGEWREAIRLNPNMLQAQRTLALSAMRTGDMGTLQTATSQMIFLQPEKPEGYALRAVAYINQKKFQLAQQDIDKAIAVDPTSQLGYVQLGNLQFAETDYAGAARSYQQGLDRDPNSSDALRGLMNSYLAQHQIDRAVAAANSQIAKAPENSEFYNLLGTSLFRAKRDFSGAEAAFSKALQLDPRNTDARLKLAQAQSTAGKLDQAIATCQQGIQTQPRVADFYILLGELYQAKENWSLAKSSLEKAREIQPGNPVTNRELANVLLDSGGNLDEALSLAQSAQRSAPNSPGAADTLGWVYYQKGEYGLALNILQQAFKLMQSQNASDNADIHYHLGLAYQKTSHPAQARQHLEQALKIDPNYPAADDIRKQLTTLKS